MAGKFAAEGGLIAQMAGVDKPQRVAQGGRGTGILFQGLQGDGGADMELAVLLLNLVQSQLVQRDSDLLVGASRSGVKLAAASHVDGVVAETGLEFQSLTQLLGSEELLNHVSSLLLLPAAGKIHRAGNPVQNCGRWP